jgi:hypothetical protein
MSPFSKNPCKYAMPSRRERPSGARRGKGVQQFITNPLRELSVCSGIYRIGKGK